MALREQPYLPLYVQDFMTDEKLNECSAESAGVYIRLMCLMHKSESYGKILLRQKDRQTDRQIFNFAAKLAKQMPYTIDVIERSLAELIDEKVLTLDGDVLYQKRMVKDAETSEKRAKSGKKGAEKTNNKESFADTFADEFAEAKTAANSENEIENENKRKRDSAERGKEATQVFAEYAGDDSELLSALLDFEAMRKKIKKPLTDKARKLLLQKLDTLSQNVNDKARYKRECLEESVLHDWQGVFSLKGFEDSAVISQPVPQELPPGKTWADVYGDHPNEFVPGMNWEDLVE